MRNFSPEMARSAMQNSGLFGESMLSKQSLNRSDLKHILRTLLTFTSLGNSERTLISQAVDEIESNQLESLSAQKNRDVSYSFVIPFSDSDPVEINIEAETDSIEQDFHNESQVDESDQSSRRNDSSYKWVVNLYTDSKELGEIWSKATFKNAMTVEMILWARNEQSVELAQLEYILPRLTRQWTHLERQMGGIGTRGGPGETQIEIDRRLIRKQISKLKQHLEKISRVRYNILDENIKLVLQSSFELGGTTLRDFVNEVGEPGYFKQSLMVYGREEEQ